MASKVEDIRIVLVGKTGTGKSATANTILGQKAFISTTSSGSVTAECQKKSGKFESQNLDVIDTPGLFDTADQEKVTREVIKCISFAAPGPHVFLVVTEARRFTEEEQQTVKIIQKLFGEKASCYTVVLFTRGDDLEADGVNIEEFISKNADLRDFVRQCHGTYHVFNNRDKDRSQVRELLEKINKMVERNGKGYYTNEMLQEAETAIEAKKKQLQRENENLTHQEAREQAEIFNEFIQAIKTFNETAVAVRQAAEASAHRAASDTAAAEAAARKTTCVIQ